VDFVMRLEDRAAGLQEIFDRTDGRLGLENKQLNRNAGSPSGSYREIYTKASRDHIAKVFARDIEYFGYEF
jgi:hypothetical protein